MSQLTTCTDAEAISRSALCGHATHSRYWVVPVMSSDRPDPSLPLDQPLIIPPRPARSKPTGKRSITREKYDALLDAFRRHGENFKAVAEDVGVHWQTAKRAWAKGWHEQKSKPWALPINGVIAKEQIEARAALAREKDLLVNDHRIARQDQLREAIEAGFTDLVDSRSKQGKVIRAARDNSIAALIVSQKLLKAAIPLADQIVAQLTDPALTVFERMRLMRQIVRFGSDAVEIAQIADEMERRALGEPDSILQVQHGINMSLDEAKETLAEVAEVLQLYGEEDEVDAIIDAEFSPRKGEDGELEVPANADDEPTKT